MSSEPLYDKKTVPEQDYRDAVNQASKIGTKLETMSSEKVRTSRKMDIARRLCQLGSAVTVFLLIVVFFVDHPAIETPYKLQLIGVLVVLCISYGIALEFSKGSVWAILFFMVVGSVSFGIGAGFTAALFHQYFVSAWP